MKRLHGYGMLVVFFLTVGLVGLIGCDTSVDVQSPNPTEGLNAAPEALGAMSQGVQKTPISGTIQFVGGGVPERIIINPGGRCHFFDLPVFTEFTGDVAGPVTVNEQIHQQCDGGRLVVSGPFEAEATWEGSTGAISGQFTTNCEPDPSQPVGVSCDGVMTTRGSGDLDGVRFKFEWGPGWYPFPYTGTAFSK